MLLASGKTSVDAHGRLCTYFSADIRHGFSIAVVGKVFFLSFLLDRATYFAVSGVVCDSQEGT